MSSSNYVQSMSQSRMKPLKFSKDISGQSRIVDTEKLSAIRVGDSEHLAIAPRSGAMTSAQISTSMGGKRRVHQEGLKMLDNHYQVIEERTKLQSMENRIKRLEYEEQRARKMEKLAN